VVYRLIFHAQAAEESVSGIPIHIVIGMFFLMISVVSFGIQKQMRKSRQESKRVLGAPHSLDTMMHEVQETS